MPASVRGGGAPSPALKSRMASFPEGKSVYSAQGIRFVRFLRSGHVGAMDTDCGEECIGT